MSKWVAKKDDPTNSGPVHVQPNKNKGGKGGNKGKDKGGHKGKGKSQQEQPQQQQQQMDDDDGEAGGKDSRFEIRRAIRMAAQEARAAETTPLTTPVGSNNKPTLVPAKKDKNGRGGYGDGEEEEYDYYDNNWKQADWDGGVQWGQSGWDWDNNPHGNWNNQGMHNDWGDWDGGGKGRNQHWNQQVNSQHWDDSQLWDDDEDEDASEWDEFLQIRGSTIEVLLSGAELGDADLKALTTHLDGVLRKVSSNHGGEYIYNLDLSCNSYITDKGVMHLATFLKTWPCCHRLKLYRNAIGDNAIKVLAPWVAEGYARELHLSDLLGRVSGDSVLFLMNAIHRKGRYPFDAGNGKNCPLWLRLEHNRLQNTEELVERIKSQVGISVGVLDKQDLVKVRPKGNKNIVNENCEVNLVLFHVQDRKGGRQEAASHTAVAAEIMAAVGMKTADKNKKDTKKGGKGGKENDEWWEDNQNSKGKGGKSNDQWWQQDQWQSQMQSGKGGKGNAIGAQTGDYYRGGANQGNHKQLWTPEGTVSSAPQDGKGKGKNYGTGYEVGSMQAAQYASPQYNYQSNAPPPLDTPKGDTKGSKNKKDQGPALKASDLVMGAASYRGTPTSGGGWGKGGGGYNRYEEAPADISSAAAFPSLGGGGAKTESEQSVGTWGANLQSVAAWGAAPAAVFDPKARAPPPKVVKPPENLHFPPANRPLEDVQDEQVFPGLPPPSSAPAPQQNWPQGGAAPQQNWPQEEEVQEEVVPEQFIAEPPEQQFPVQQEVEWRPLSFAEKGVLKAKKKLREVEKIEEMLEAGEKIEKTQLMKVQKKAQLVQELKDMENRSQAQGGRTLAQLELAEKRRKEHEIMDRAVTTIQRYARGALVRWAIQMAKERELEEQRRVEREAEEAKRRAEEERKAEEDRKRRAEEERLEAERRAKAAEEERIRKAQEEERRRQEEARRKAAEEERRREEQRRYEEEMARRAAEEAEARRRAAEEAQRRAAEEARLRAEEERRAAEEAKRRAAEEAQRRAAEEEARREAQRRAEEAQRHAEEEAELQRQADQKRRREETQRARAPQTAPPTAPPSAPPTPSSAPPTAPPSAAPVPSGRNPQMAPPSGPPSGPPGPPPVKVAPTSPPVAPPPPALDLPGEPWFYRTPSLEVQGPFDAKRMQQWHNFRYFTEDLPVKIEWYSDFYPLGALFTSFEAAFSEPPMHPEAELRRMQPPPPVWEEPAPQVAMKSKAPPPTQPVANVMSPSSVPSQAPSASPKGGPSRVIPPAPATPAPQPGQAQAPPQQAPTLPPALQQQQQPPQQQPKQPPTQQPKGWPKTSPPQAPSSTPQESGKDKKGANSRQVPPEPPGAPPSAPGAPPSAPPQQAPKASPQGDAPKAKAQPKSEPPKEEKGPSDPYSIFLKRLGGGQLPEMPPPPEPEQAPEPPAQPVPPAQPSGQPPAKPPAAEPAPVPATAPKQPGGVWGMPKAKAMPPSPGGPAPRAPPPVEPPAPANCLPVPGTNTRQSQQEKQRQEKEEEKARKLEEQKQKERELEEQKEKERQEKEKAELEKARQESERLAKEKEEKEKRDKEIAEKEKEEKIRPASMDEDDDDERIQEVSGLDQKYVGLVIGKNGETIKNFKKQSGCSIEIDQNLPEGMPRAVIYRGSRKQVKDAKRLVESLVQRARPDEKSEKPVTTGILGRGPADKGVTPVTPSAKDTENRTAAEVESDKVLPPWRRAKGEDEREPLKEPDDRMRGARPLQPRKEPLAWGNAGRHKKEEQVEAAPSGSLTGAIGLGGLTMRPAWQNRKEEAKDEPKWDRTDTSDQKYSKPLLWQCRMKILRGKAYEVPAEMMTMTTGPRPKYEPSGKEDGEKKGKALSEDAMSPDFGPSDPPTSSKSEAKGENGKKPKTPKTPTGKVERSDTGDLDDNDGADGTSKTPGPYENCDGDSKVILRCKKKLREILKIEERIASGENVEPKQLEKVGRKQEHLDELKFLEEAITNGAGANGSVS